MGNDGGSIPKRRDMVKKKKEERKLNQKLVRLTCCTLTNEPFQPPLALDKLGNLYNKEAVLRALIDKKMPTPYSHIHSLKDIRTAHIMHQQPMHIHCPLTGIEYTPHYNFIAIWKCGCVMSEKALKEIGGEGKCPVCNCPYCKDSDVISLNMTSEEKDKLRDYLVWERKCKLAQKDKVKEKVKVGDVSIPSVEGGKAVLGKRMRTVDDVANEIIDKKKVKMDGILSNTPDSYVDDFMSRPSHFGIR